MDQLGNPQNNFPAVHIAGTNGKGSVTAMIASVLKSSGLKTGMYTSPHLEKINERFQINGRLISNHDLKRLSKNLARRFPHLTEFEFLTVLGFVWFAEQNIDVAVVETGLGGRLDATNVLSNVLVSVITTIDFDHMDWLGNTLEKIAYEKAGIIKRGSPIVTGAMGPALKVIGRVAKNRQAALIHSRSGKNLPALPLEGKHQLFNAAIALSAINVINRSYFKITPAHIENGLKSLRWPGRFERFMIGSGPRRKIIILDGAHNPGGCRVLAGALKDKKMPPVDLLFGVLGDKDFSSMAKILSPSVRRCVTVPVPSERSADPRILAGLPSWKRKSSPQKSVSLGWKKILNENRGRPIVVAGSLYLVGEIRRMVR
jgi:dihydrofolate synthase/folylpolyglutamate synthase